MIACIFEWTWSSAYFCGCLALCICNLASKLLLIVSEGVCKGGGDGGNMGEVMDVGCWMECEDMCLH